MRIVVFSDVHGNLQALNNLTTYISNVGYDTAFFLGDIFGYYYDQEECLKLIKKIPNLVWLKGNHDVYAVESFLYGKNKAKLISQYGHSYDHLKKRFCTEDMNAIASLPSHVSVSLEGKTMGFFHGRPRNPLEGRIYPDSDLPEKEFCGFDVVFVGHTHCKMDRMIKNTRIISPGSIGQPRDGKGYGFLIYNTDDDSCEFVNVNVNKKYLLNAINTRDNGLHKLYDVLSREQ